ncbi:MAG: MFS transporter, partial [Terriglobales bacterium]
MPARGEYLHALSASFLGWMLDAFDFFVVVFLVGTLAHQFAVPKSAIVWSITATLAMRPLGAFLFGLLADRYGRRLPLMANVVYFAAIEVACGFAPNFTVFLILRALFGIGMGGEWGVGAALTMEAAPRARRGVLSGLLQSGYPIGYLLAALAARFILPALGWRAMFWVGGLPALLALYIRAKVPESEAWRRNRAGSVRAIFRSLAGGGKLVVYLAILMTLMQFLSHGTQDLYPDFLATVHHLSASTVAWLAVLYNLGALAGALFFGWFSEPWGRRRAMLAATALSLAVIPFWVGGGRLWVLAGAAFLMQAGVQGAWGIIPAHLNELVPDATRGLLPGLMYQFGILVAAPTSNIEYALRDRFGYAHAMGGFMLAIILAVAIAIALGPEHTGRDFLRAPDGGPRRSETCATGRGG